MLTFTLHLSALLLLLSTTTPTSPAYTPTFSVLLNCGSSSTQTSPDGRIWDDDVHSKFSPSATTAADAATASRQDSSVNQVPFLTARLSLSSFTYTFPTTPGPLFLRLYFYPATYSSNTTTTFLFSVTANNFTLLSNFSAALTATSTLPKTPSLIKEYILNINPNHPLLTLTFTPSPNSLAFINGIELLSLPANLYIHGNDDPIPLVQYNYPYTFDHNNTALETLYRLNVGGNTINGNNDTGLSRQWDQDDPYLFSGAIGYIDRLKIPIQYTPATPPYTAPEVLYTKARIMGDGSRSNLTWIFYVDTGFYYLVRLHFCEFSKKVTAVNQRVFYIYINNQTAEEKFDVFFWSGGNNIPVKRDYVVSVPEVGGHRVKQELWVTLHPNIEDSPLFHDAFLNGLEIFKLNDTRGILAAPNPNFTESKPESNLNPASPIKPGGKHLKPFWVVVGGVSGVVIALCVLGFFIFRLRQRGNDFGLSLTKSTWGPLSVVSKSTKSNKTHVSSLPSDLCRHLLLSEIRSATCNFDENFVIGIGGFGNVYRGYIDIDGASVAVAIKRLNPESSQGAHEFQTEIIMLSKLRHVHLVSLIGYCDDDGEMILVYEYMVHGTLRDHLYKSNNPPLPWNQRLLISIGAARGLHYLHTGVKQMIIHRDVKSTNILLDEKWVAKVSDFGLSKMGPSGMTQTHVTTMVKGSFGYVDPEYYRTKQLTNKSDVYSFGVVLLELLCARSPIIPSLPKEQVNLAVWGRYCYRKGILNRIVDPYLKGHIAPECLRKFGEIIDSCLRDHGIERPSMNDVVWGLEFALQLQEAADRNINTGNECGYLTSPSVPLCRYEETTSNNDKNVFSTSIEHVSSSKTSGVSTMSSDGQSHDKFKIENVFSELINPKGR